ncbi:GGDEF domain-containing protein [Edaphobacter albus]|uniref:GGDEF domain-containing protein n=1 Tax=Edaphobacter sp. 4G125 TaxID=2763071 RepID=UPI00164600DD|nr:GGDEF domain-containing protein [Edaphobacter sp. 4G125]QNI36080.1 GGDEF domain-containing protein [Edaphobacter sp. 4G125]
MDTTLILANALIFALSAGLMLISSRSAGGIRGAVWFAGSNLSRGAAMLIIGANLPNLGRVRYPQPIAGVLVMTGVLMLHQSFAELLERKAILLRVQCGLVAAITVALVYFSLFPSRSSVPIAALHVVEGLLYLLVAVLVFRFSGKETAPVGWFTALALAIYGLILFLKAASDGDHRSAAAMAALMLMACLVTTVVTAFGFLSLSTTKLRLELLWRAQVDDLTGLLNRWALKRMALREIQRCRRAEHCLSLITMDLDGLKTINDAQGHSCGDVVLQAVSGVLQETVRANDSIARIGGDEFCVLLPDTCQEEAVLVAERLREEIDGLVIRYRGVNVQTGASLGVSSSVISGLDWQRLADDSDAALYQAKREGRNRVVLARSEEITGGEPRQWDESRLRVSRIS